MSKNISHSIVEVCKKLGIPYKSSNDVYIEYYNDAQRLCQAYRDLKNIAIELQEISEKHNIDGLGIILEDDVKLIEQIDHDIIRLAKQIHKED